MRVVVIVRQTDRQPHTELNSKQIPRFSRYFETGETLLLEYPKLADSPKV